MIELLGILGTLLAVAGTLLNNRRRIECFPLWLAANVFMGTAHALAGIWSLLICNIIFFALAIDGLRRWRKP